MLNSLSYLQEDGTKFLVLSHRISVNDQNMDAMQSSSQKRKRKKKENTQGTCYSTEKGYKGYCYYLKGK